MIQPRYLRSVRGGVLGGLGLAALLFLAGCAGPVPVRGTPRNFLWVKVYHEGGSMEPTLGSKGESVVAMFFPYEDLKGGDIVLYWSEPRRLFIIHRLREFRAGFGWTVQGDNPMSNYEPDPDWVTRDNFIGLTVLAGSDLGAAVSLARPDEPVKAAGRGR